MSKPKIHILDFISMAHQFNKARMDEFYEQTGMNILLLQVEYKQRGYEEMKHAIDEAVSLKYHSMNMPKAKDWEIDYRTDHKAPVVINGRQYEEKEIVVRDLRVMSFDQMRAEMQQGLKMIKHRIDERKK